MWKRLQLNQGIPNFNWFRMKKALNVSEQIQRDGRVDLLKWIALITMIIDHIGIVFFPDEAIYRVIGRIAFPIFIILLAEGAVRTRNKKAHLIRLWVFACISQIPYLLLIDPYVLNVIFTMAIAVTCIRLPYLIPVVFIGLMIIPVDYSWYGVGLALIYYYLRKWPGIACILAVNLTFLYAIQIGSFIQFWAVIGLVLPLIIRKVSFRIPNTSKYFFYWFYPVHLAILFIISKVY
ncbi:TraX family protein [Psychrobacillus sp. FSL H8-0484]|uniref:TraX family protein n=1 Tax=Psychrobacillus sp. FSL H8-0484 TaxID=2921390 RepID=UPI0030FA5A42